MPDGTVLAQLLAKVDEITDRMSTLLDEVRRVTGDQRALLAESSH